MKNKFNNYYKWIKSHIILIEFIVITLISIIIRIRGIGLISRDMRTYLIDWFQTLKEKGGLFALNNNIGNYNTPYVIILAILTYLPINPVISIKAVSIIFDYILAISCAKLVTIILKDKNTVVKQIYALITYSIAIMLPTVVLNSSIWGQCDSIYTSFIILSLIYLIKHKYVKSFILLGISFAFKLQFIFVLPVYILFYVSERKFPIYEFLIIPAVNVIMCLPAVISGKSILSCMSVYLNQAQEYVSCISLNFPNIYNFMGKVQNSENILPVLYDWLPKVMILITGFVFFIIMIYVIIKKVKFNEKLIIETALWSVLIMTFLLPYMHDRYMFIADVLSVVYFMIDDRHKLYVPIGTNICSLYTYMSYLFRINYINIKYIALLNLVVITLLTIDFIKHTFDSSKKIIEDTQEI